MNTNSNVIGGGCDDLFAVGDVVEITAACMTKGKLATVAEHHFGKIEVSFSPQWCGWYLPEQLRKISSENVKEHAPPPLSSEGKETEELHGGCCVSSCSLLVVRGTCGNLEFWDSKANIHWVDHRSLIGGINVRTYADGNLHVSLEGDVGEIAEEVMNRLKRVLFGILPPVDIPLKRETTSGIWPLEHVQKQLR